jgi:hypothetical protein
LLTPQDESSDAVVTQNLDRSTESSPGKGGDLHFTIQVDASVRHLDFKVFIPKRHFMHRACALVISGGQGDKYEAVFESIDKGECKGYLRVTIVFDEAYHVVEDDEEGEEDENETGVAVVIGEQKKLAKRAMRRVGCVMNGGDRWSLNGVEFVA